MPAPVPNVTTRSTAHHLLQALNDIEIDYLFCNFGTDHAPIIEELARFQAEGLRAPKVILCPHENVAMHMAGGYAQMTGRGQAVLVHVDAGTANAALGMHNLFRNRIPVMLIGGSAPFTSFGELTGSRYTYVHFIQQPFDQGSLVRPYVKWEYSLPSGITTREVLRRAHTIMQSEPTGPVYLMLPREVLTEAWDESAVRSFPAEQFGPLRAGGADPDVIDDLAARLLRAKRPALITGYAGRDAAASDAIERLSALAGIRVIDYLTFSNIGRGAPQFGGYQTDDLGGIDLGLLVDVDVPWLPIATTLDPSTFWAQIDIDVLKSASPMWSFPANLRIQGRSSRILDQLAQVVERVATATFRSNAAARVKELIAANEARSKHAAQLAADKGRHNEINPHYLCAELGRVLDADDIVVNEAVTRQSIPNLQIPRPKPGTMISNAGGGLGASGGTALGIKLACPERCIVQIVGDGSFYFNNPSAVYALSSQYGLPIFTIVMDNSGWAAVKGATLRVYPQGSAMSQAAFQASLPTGMDFSLIARAAGAYGEKLVDPDEVSAAIERCLQEVRAGRSALLHACVTKL